MEELSAEEALAYGESVTTNPEILLHSLKTMNAGIFGGMALAVDLAISSDCECETCCTIRNIAELM